MLANVEHEMSTFLALQTPVLDLGIFREEEVLEVSVPAHVMKSQSER